MKEHEYTKEIVCPWCGYEYSDSWECGENNADYRKSNPSPPTKEE